MSDLMRMTGMYSGMDTESVVRQLVQAKQVKVDNLKKEQTKFDWKRQAWQDMNSKIYNLYKNTLSKMRLTGSYLKRSTVSSDPTKATVVASDGSANGTQSLKINKLAKSGYLTGAKLYPHTITEEKEETDADGNVTKVPVTKEVPWKADDYIFNYDPTLTGKKISIKTGTGDDEKLSEIEIDSDMTFGKLANELKKAGVNASFDEVNQRFFISAKDTGVENDFVLSGDEDTLSALGINENDADCVRIAAQDAEIELNGATFTSSSNTITVNGLTINALGVTDEEISIVTTTDHQGVYDMIKEFITEYNEVINEISKKYGADSAKDYNVLSDDEKAAMTDEQVETWEGKIKDSLLRRDGTLYTIMNSLTSIMSAGYEVNGEKKYLFSYGIETLRYDEAKDNERYAYHINGDPEDENTSEKEDKLKKAIAQDPDGVADFFSAVSKKMYDRLYELMGRTDYSSIYKVYNDKQMDDEYNKYTSKIKKAEKELSDYEDKWYKKFSAMEVALSKLQSNQNAVSGLLGMK